MPAEIAVPNKVGRSRIIPASVARIGSISQNRRQKRHIYREMVGIVLGAHPQLINGFVADTNKNMDGAPIKLESVLNNDQANVDVRFSESGSSRTSTLGVGDKADLLPPKEAGKYKSKEDIPMANI